MLQIIRHDPGLEVFLRQRARTVYRLIASLPSPRYPHSLTQPPALQSRVLPHQGPDNHRHPPHALPQSMPKCHRKTMRPPLFRAHQPSLVPSPFHNPAGTAAPRFPSSVGFSFQVLLTCCSPLSLLQLPPFCAIIKIWLKPPMQRNLAYPPAGETRRLQYEGREQ